MKTLKINLENGEHRKLKAWASLKGESMSYLIREIVDNLDKAGMEKLWSAIGKTKSKN